MRIDRFLFFIRLAKSRTAAQGLVAAGFIRIDGRRVTRPSDEVRVGSVVALPLRDRTRVLRVLAMPARRGPPAEARGCYEDLDPHPGGTGVDDPNPAT
ncbi:RNA-binding S4 domain-containing protein [Sphingomonas sabuli]|uniref:RNA-binding S4 domain-containing protein n=1 Tax=Sphingomonas sabuli TaxID=2764186 RepID=A0A7G9KZK7_9SPHN|nr:S4 domain-containing protein [Sphingomonas sabuli]QNM81806.1 RNA-binding S4 domain-containing protein [Sphingomonas sabuli]